jgi:hypothetical protein
MSPSEYGCAALRVLAKSLTLQTAEIQQGAMQVIAEAMRRHPGAAGVQEEGCAALTSLAIPLSPDDSQTVGVQTFLVERASISAIVTAMRQHTAVASMQEQGCRALRSLANNPHNKAAIVEADGLTAILNSMKTHGRVPAVQEFGCGALWHLMVNSSANKRQLVESGGVGLILTALRVHVENGDVVAQTCAVRILFLSVTLFDPGLDCKF